MDHFRVHRLFTFTTRPEVEVEHLLAAWAAGFAARCRAEPTHPRDPTRVGELRLGRRGLERDECDAFLRTWKRFLVRIGFDGAFTLPGLRDCPPTLHLVGRSGNATALHTEYLIQIGAIAELIEDHGWARDELAFEQGEWDTLGYRDNRVQLAVEAKARADASDADGLARLEASFMKLSDDPAHLAPRNHIRKWRALATYVEDGPVDVLLIASGARRWLRATRRPNGATRVEPLARL